MQNPRVAAIGLAIFALTFLPGCMAMRFVPVAAAVKTEPSPEIQIVRFPTSDGLTLEGRLYPAQCDRPRRAGDTTAYPRLPEQYKRAVVLLCHGVGENNTSGAAGSFEDAGFRVFKFDYRGFGASDPAPLSNEGFAEDAGAALRYLWTRPDVDPEKIVVFGHSMGGVYAMAAAAEAEGQGHPVSSVITAAAFSSWRRVANFHVPVIGYLLGGVTGPEPTDFARRLGHTHLLITHARNDREVPVENAYRLFDAATGAGVKASICIVPQGGHDFTFWGSALLDKVTMDFAMHYLTPSRGRLLEGLEDGVMPGGAGEKSPSPQSKAPAGSG